MGTGTYQDMPNTDASSYETIDPNGFTAATQSQLYNQLENALQRMNNVQTIDQDALQRQFLNNFGGLTSAVTAATSPLSQQLNNQVDFLTNRAVGDISNQFSGLNSLYSSGFGKTAGEAAGNIAGQAGVQLANAQLGLLNPLATQSMSGIQNSALQQQALQNQNYNLIAQLNSAMNQPQYTNPDQVYQPSPWEQFVSNVSPFISAASFFV